MSCFFVFFGSVMFVAFVQGGSRGDEGSGLRK